MSVLLASRARVPQMLGLSVIGNDHHIKKRVWIAIELMSYSRHCTCHMHNTSIAPPTGCSRLHNNPHPLQTIHVCSTLSPQCLYNDSHLYHHPPISLEQHSIIQYFLSPCCYDNVACWLYCIQLATSKGGGWLSCLTPTPWATPIGYFLSPLIASCCMIMWWYNCPPLEEEECLISL